MDRLNHVKAHLSDANLAGLVAGALGMIVSFIGRGLVPGRELGDPVPLVLALQSLIRGNILYLNWRGLVWPLLFLAGISLMTTAVLHFLTGIKGWQEDDARQAARVAVGINVGVIAITKVDAFIVGMWYLMAGFLGVVMAGIMAGWMSRLIFKYRSASP